MTAANKPSVVPPHGMPRGASVAQLAEQGAVKSGGGKGTTKRQSAVQHGLRLGFPTDHSSDAEYGDPVAETQMIVTIDELRSYERDPRRTSLNPQYHEIKESIRSSGLHNPLSITRRPDEEFYIIEAGGNTRLRILRELWEETKDEKYFRLSVVFKPWKRESTVLAKHIVENNTRGEMTFWDNANGLMELKDLLEKESGQSMSLRQFEDVLRSEGVSCNKSDLAKFGFAVKNLKYLGGALPHLPSRAVAEIQPRLNLLKRFAEKHSSIAEKALYEEVLAPAMASYGDRFTVSQADSDRHMTFDTDEFLCLCEESLASRCEVELKWLQMVLEGLKRNPDASIDEIAKPAAAVEPPHQEKPPKRQGAEGAGRVADKDSTRNAGVSTPAEQTTPPSAASQTSDEDIQESGEVLTTLAIEADSELLPAILRDISLFAEHVGVQDAVRINDALPFGFWMDVVDLDSGADALKHVGWWVLCSLSGQLHGEFISLLPDDAAWRHTMENDQDAVDRVLGGLPDFLHFHHIWALDGFPPNLFETYLRLLGAMRRLKSVDPMRFEMGEPT